MLEGFADPTTITSIEALEAEFEKVLLLKDKGVVRIVMSAVVSSKLPIDAVWVMIIAPSSGGKTEIINSLTGLDFVEPISDLTTNTFASGFKQAGKESSLLLRLQNGFLTFKDLTTILSKNKDAKREIMGQLREIFDGEYTKHTGNGMDIKWRGKMCALAGCTEVIYRHLEEMSAMGDRFIMYSMEQAPRLDTARRALNNAGDMPTHRQHLKDCVTYYINFVISRMTDDEIELDEKTKEELLMVADFATRARSAVLTDFKTGQVDFVPSAEMPMRVATQLYNLAAGIIALHRANPHPKPMTPESRGELSEFDKKILYKTAFDSIPISRRQAIKALARYKGGVTTAGLATFLNLPSDSVKKYLYQVNALGLCKRVKKGGKQGDLWIIRSEYRAIMQRFENIRLEEGTLEGEEMDSSQEDAWEDYNEARAELETDSLTVDDDLPPFF